MKRLQSLFFMVFFTGLIMTLSIALYLQQPELIQKIDNAMLDTAMRFHGTTPPDTRITIVDIDEKSLKQLGQWPWSRDKIAKILTHLTDAGAAVIGLDIVFAEKDNSSPVNIAQRLNIPADRLADYDKILAETLLRTPTITGFIFDFKHPNNNPAPATNAIYIQRGKGEKEHLLEAKGVTANIPLIQQNSISSGSFNTLPDDDGIVRRVPMLIAYDDAIYPALSFEMVRALMNIQKVEIIYDENGVDHIRLGALTIPTDRQGKMFVQYHGGAKSYPYLSAVDIFNNRFDPADIQNRIVLVGTSASGLLDLRATPFDNVYPGVEVHANAIDNIINQDFIAAPSYTKGITVTMIVTVVILSALIVLTLTPLFSFLWSIGFMALLVTFLYQMLFHEHIVLNFAYPILAAAATITILTFLKIYNERSQKELIRDKFAKKVSPQVAAQLLKSDKDIFMTSEEEITIFFSDIRNFTTISESFAHPAILIEYLNRYMSPMSEIIISYEGTIDKYIGDAIMAYWNAPLRVENHADKALSAALKQLSALKQLNATLQKKAFPPIDIGIGIHTGKAVVGEMGSSGRSDYTVIGDTINLGSRIEGLCKTYGAKILISEATKAQLQEAYRIREVDRVQVKGKDSAVTIYAVTGFGTFSQEEAEIEKTYRHARRLYKEARFHEAYTLFEKLYRRVPEKLFALYMERCQVYEKEKIKEFDAVYRFTTK